MGSKSSTPDPYASAAAQEQANQQATALNEFNQVTPYGDLNWTNPGQPGATATVSLSPIEQQILSNTQNTQLGMQGATSQALANATAATANPANLPTNNVNIGSQEQQIAGNFTNPTSEIANLQNAMGTSAGVAGSTLGMLPTGQTTAQNAGQVANTALDAAGAAASAGGPNYSGLTPLAPTGMGAQQQVANALFGQSAQMLSPEYAQQQAALQSQLQSQGLAPTSQAAETQENNLALQQDTGWNNASMQAISGATAQQQAQQQMALSNQQQEESLANNQYMMPISAASTLAGAYGTATGANTSDVGAYTGANSALTADSNATAPLMSEQLSQQAAIPADASSYWSAAEQPGQTNFQDTLTQQNNLVNILNALQGGQQVQNPSFMGENTTTAAAPINQDIYGSAGMNASSMNNMLSGLGSLGGSALGNIGEIASVVGGL